MGQSMSTYTGKLPFDQQHRVNPWYEIMEVLGWGGAVLSWVEFTAERAQ